MKKKVYLLVRKIDDNHCMCMYATTKKIRDELFDIELRQRYCTHFIEWCKYHDEISGDDIINEVAWRKYLTVVKPNTREYFYEERKMTKEELRNLKVPIFTRRFFKDFKRRYELGEIKF